MFLLLLHHLFFGDLCAFPWSPSYIPPLLSFVSVSFLGFVLDFVSFFPPGSHFLEHIGDKSVWRGRVWKRDVVSPIATHRGAGVGTRWMSWLCIIKKWSRHHGAMWRGLWLSLQMLCCLCLLFIDSLEALEWFLPIYLHYRYQTGKSRVAQKGYFCSRKHQSCPLLVVFKGEGALTEGSARFCWEPKKRSLGDGNSCWWSMSCLQVTPIL